MVTRRPPRGARARRGASRATRTVADVEARQRDLDRLLVTPVQRQQRIEVAEPQVPAALALLAVAESRRSVRDRRLARDGVEDHRLPVGMLALVAEIGGHQEATGHTRAVTLVERDQQRQIGEALAVVLEARDAPVDPELLEHHVAHGHRQRAVGARLRGQPVIRELDVVGVIR